MIRFFRTILTSVALIALLSGTGFALGTSSIQQGQVEAHVSTVYQSTVGQNSVDTAQLPVNFSFNIPLSNGTGGNSAKVVFKDNRTLAASASETIDINGGTFFDAFGNAVTLTKVLMLWIHASGANANNVVVGNAALNAFAPFFNAVTDTFTIRPNGSFIAIAPDSVGYVASATAKNILIANSGAGTSVTYDIVIVGN